MTVLSARFARSAALASLMFALTACSSCGKNDVAQHPASSAGGSAGSGGSDASIGGSAGAIADGAAGETGVGGALPEASAGDAGAGGGASCMSCTAYGQPTDAGTVQIAAISELSGLAASRQHPGVLYAHNDSGDSARFFALDVAGAQLGEFQLTGAVATDWEDMDLGPCPAGTCVFLGDIGDNGSSRSKIRVYRVAEPNVSVGKPVGTVANVAYDMFEFQYEGGARNAETLMVHPVTGDLYIVSKVSSGVSSVFRIPAPTSPTSSPVLIHSVATVQPPGGSNLFTGGTVHSCADRLLLRTYTGLWEYRLQKPPFESIFAATPVAVPSALETQGEAVTYSSDGMAYVTASEGASPALHVSSCP